MMPISVVALAGCLAVGAGSDQVTLRDLSPAFPGWEVSSPEAPVALAPAPGVQRWFRLPELSRIAARFHIEAPPQGEVCVERKAAPLEPAALLEVMRKQLPSASIEILEYSHLPAPEGTIELPLSGLRHTPAGGFWTGSILYGGNHRFLIWAKVKVLVAVPRVIAVESLKPGRVLEPSQLTVEMREDCPSAEGYLTDVAQAAGKVVRRSVPPGTALCAQWLEIPKEVVRGDSVHVEVWSGGAHLELNGEAEASGSIGQSVLVRNPVSKKRFLARVVGKGQVAVGKGSL